MYKIEKTINIENFISRIPSALSCVDEKNVQSSWGHIPYDISIYDLYPFLAKTEKNITYTYRFLIDSYNSIIDFFKKSEFYVYDSSYGIWKLYKTYYSNAIFDENYRGTFAYLPQKVKYSGDIVCISDLESIKEKDKIVNYFKRDFKKVFENSINVFKDDVFLIENIENILGKRRTPIEIKGKLVPIYIYYSEIDRYIKLLEDLKSNLNKNCCRLTDYNDYGGDDFYNFLIKEKEKKPLVPSTENSLIPSINIPLLITYDYKDLGIMNAYEDEESVSYYTTKVFAQSNSQMMPPQSEYPKNPGKSKNEDGENINWQTYSNGNGIWWYSEGKVNPKTNTVLRDENGNLEWSYPLEYKLDFSKSLSQIKSFKKRKINYDENDNELPGLIPNEETNKLLLPYPSLYVEYKDENGHIIDKTKEFGENYIINVSESNGIINGSQIYKTIYNFNIENANELDSFNNAKEYDEYVFTISVAINGDNREDALRNAEKLVKEELNTRNNKLRNEFKSDYLKDNSLDGAKQKCKINYTIKYDDITENLFSTDILMLKIMNSITFIYVVGGMYKQSKENIILSEEPNKPSLGIWHEETYPLYVNKKFGNYLYDEIDFKSKLLNIDYNGIDYERKNVLISDKVWFNDENMSINNTNYFTFRDDKNIGISMPFNEKISAIIERGNSASFEKILKLNEVKTFADLENYGNNYFNI